MKLAVRCVLRFWPVIYYFFFFRILTVLTFWSKTSLVSRGEGGAHTDRKSRNVIFIYYCIADCTRNKIDDWFFTPCANYCWSYHLSRCPFCIIILRHCTLALAARGEAAASAEPSSKKKKIIYATGRIYIIGTRARAGPLNLRSCWHRATVRHPILKYRRRRRKRRRN